MTTSAQLDGTSSFVDTVETSILGGGAEFVGVVTSSAARSLHLLLASDADTVDDDVATFCCVTTFLLIRVEMIIG
jgi:hypothetical protein